jgi:nucleoid-associated protein YgaU
MISPGTPRYIAELFAEQGWQWLGVVPMAEDIDLAIRKLWDVLRDQPSGTQIESGRLLVRKIDDDDFDVYVNLGRV